VEMLGQEFDGVLGCDYFSATGVRLRIVPQRRNSLIDEGLEGVMRVIDLNMKGVFGSAGAFLAVPP